MLKGQKLALEVLESKRFQQRKAIFVVFASLFFNYWLIKNSSFLRKGEGVLERRKAAARVEGDEAEEVREKPIVVV